MAGRFSRQPPEAAAGAQWPFGVPQEFYFRLLSSEKMNSTRKMTNRIFAIVPAMPAMPQNPSAPATIATSRKINV